MQVAWHFAHLQTAFSQMSVAAAAALGLAALAQNSLL